MKRTVLLTALLVFVSLTAFHQNAAAGIIDSLYVKYQSTPSIATANTIFEELFREEFSDSLVHFDKSAESREVEIQVDLSMADYYISCQDLNSAIAARKRAIAMLYQSNQELEKQTEDITNDNYRWMWLSILLGVLLLASMLALLLIWRKNAGMKRELTTNQHIKSNFVSFISQELRDPLLTMMEAGQGLQSDGKSSSNDNKRIGDMIVTRCTSMLNLLTRMDIKPKNDTHEMRSGDFVYFIRTAVEAHAQEAISRKIKLEFKAPLKTLFVTFAAEKIQHVIDLLIRNSLTYTAPQGHVIVELPVPEKERLKLTVTDNGRGIPTESQPYIFSPGHNSRILTENDSADKEIVINTTLIKLILEEIGGAVSFKSEPGKETTFTIDVPLLPDNASAEEHDKAMPNIDKWLRQDDDDKRNAPMAFVVESNEDEAFLVARHLNGTFNLRYARDGHEALQNAQGLLPDIIVTDVALPDMEGEEFVRRLRTDEVLCHTPIIAMTNDTSSKERLKYIKAGVDALLIKPINPEEMRIVTHQIVKLRAAQRKRKEIADADSYPDTDAVKLSKSDNEFINKLVDVIHAQMAQGDIDMERISAAMSLSRKQLRSRVMELTGLTPVAYILQVRLNYAKRMMGDSGMSLTQIANKCCFQNLSHFSKAFKQQFGIPPQQYRKSMDGIR